MAESLSAGALRLALYSGLCVRHDAISNGLRLKLDAADQWRAAGSDVAATGFVHHIDDDDPRVLVVDRVSSLLRIPQFRAANVHVFEFGIYYPLFDAVFVVPDEASVVGVYHNVTPPALADDPDARAVLERSLVQRHNLSRANHVVTHSDYSREELLALGFDAERVSVIPLPPSAGIGGQPVPDRRAAGPVKLLYVGRFVRSKGVLDLLDAVASLRSATSHPFELALAGNPRLSSVAVLDEVRKRCDGELSGVARVVLAPNEAALSGLYAESDVFVIPSYHEGYCVPVVEALASGCHVVAYDSSNLPFVLSGLGSLVATGDVTMLTKALAESIARFALARNGTAPLRVHTTRGDLEEAVWREAIRVHLDGCSEVAFQERWRAVLESVVAQRADRTPAGVR